MKNSENNECKTWEEEFYWKRFYVMHFYKVLPNDFFHHLVLPSKFAENMTGKIPKKVSLLGPSGSSWEVEVSTTGDLALVGEGWKDFAKAYNLEENYLLMFKYTQNSSFEVLIFDQKNSCEKEYSYFVKKGLPKPNEEVNKKRSADETASTEIMEDGDFVLLKKLKKNSADQGKKNVGEAPKTTPFDDFSDKTRDDEVEVINSEGRPIHQVSGSHVSNEAGLLVDIPIMGVEGTNSKGQSAGKPKDGNVAGSSKLSQLNNIQQTPTGKSEKEIYEAVVFGAGNNDNFLSNYLSARVMNGIGTPGTSRSRIVSAKSGRSARRTIPRSGKKQAYRSYTQRLSKEYMSRRRVVTDEEKEAALRRANEAFTEGSFLVVMRPSGVYKRFFLNIPADWVMKNLSSHHQKVILRVGDKTWVTIFYNYSRSGHSGGLATGWKNFAVGNNLEDSDVCVFKPVSRKGDATITLNVEIFRVVQEITPLKPLLCSLA